jgi:hypothetical protein
MIALTNCDDVILIFKSLGLGATKAEPILQQVGISWTGVHFGGRRPWFICRGCMRRAALLYAPGELFQCRRCCGLVYASQQESLRDRSLSQAQKIRLRLGGSPSTFDLFPERPERMHRRTYDRLRARGEKAEAIYSGLLQRWLDRTGMRDRARARSRWQTGRAPDRPQTSQGSDNEGTSVTRVRFQGQTGRANER